LNAGYGRNRTDLALIVDAESFPEKTIPFVPPAKNDSRQLAQYVEKAELKYRNEGGIREYELPELVVSAKRILPKESLRNSVYYSTNSASSSITEEDIEKYPPMDFETLLSRIPGLSIDGNTIIIRGNSSFSGDPSPLLLIDGMPAGTFRLSSIGTIVNITEVSHIDVLKDGAAAVFGSRGGNGVISIFTKGFKNSLRRDQTQPPNIKTISPLGYQQPVEFYAPKYDTPEKRNARTPDFRTTIHWQPVVEVDSSGVASFEFYTADEQTSYTMIIEGLADDGKIIRKEAKLWSQE